MIIQQVVVTESTTLKMKVNINLDKIRDDSKSQIKIKLTFKIYILLRKQITFKKLINLTQNIF